MADHKESSFFDKIKVAARIVSLNTEIAVLVDQLHVYKRQFGERTYDLMADQSGNKAELAAIYEEYRKLIKPFADGVAKKEARKRELEHGAPEQAPALPQSHTTGGGADASQVQL